MRVVKNFKAQADLSLVELPKWKAERMYIQGYRFIGKHSAIKICEWTKKGIRGCSQCYKHQFYGISSLQCIQMTPTAFFCDFNCLHCWRSLNFTLPKQGFKWESPEFIINNCIKEHIKCLQGFKRDKDRHETIKEAEKPKHFAISLSGEPAIYPYLSEMIDLIKQKGMTAFLVTNGAHPDKIKFLLKHQPTNLYVSLHAPNKELFKKECCPMIKDGWKNLNETLSLLKEFDCNTVIRLTLSKQSNMFYPEQYAKIIESSNPKFVEVKGYMAIGGARAKMGPKAMPSFQEISDFAKEIKKNGSYRIIDKSEKSNVVLMSK